MRCGGSTDIDWRCHLIKNNKAHETSPLWQRPNTMTHATDPRPCSSFSAARKENTFVLLCSSMCKSKCQIHHITGRREITANEIQHAHSERALVGACESSRGHMERWIRLLSDSVFSLVLGLQLTVMIRRDRCLSVWTRKTMSNGAFDVIYFLLSHIPDYFNGKLGNKLFFMLGHTLRLCLYCIINVFIMYVVLHFIFLEIIVTIIPLILYCNPRGFVCFCVNLQISGPAVKSYKLKKFNK